MKMTTKQLYGTGLLISTVALLALVGCEVGPGSKPPAVDPTAQASLSVAPNPVAEGSAVVVTATLSAALSNDVTIPLTLSAGTAETGDYGALASITITAGATTGTGKVTTAQDDDTDDETFTVALGSLPSSVTAGSPSSVEVTIDDDDTAQSAEPDLPYAMRWWDVLSPEQRERALYGATATDEQARAAQIDYGALDTDTKKEVNATAREIFGAGGHESVGAWWQTLDCRERRIAVGDGNTDDSESPYCAEYPGS